MPNPENPGTAPETREQKSSQNKTGADVITGEIETNALSVLNAETLKELTRLKKIIDKTTGQNQLYAIENLVVAAFKANMLTPQVLEMVGFKPGVAQVLVDIANQQATVRQLDEVWKD